MRSNLPFLPPCLTSTSRSAPNGGQMPRLRSERKLRRGAGNDLACDRHNFETMQQSMLPDRRQYP